MCIRLILCIGLVLCDGLVLFIGLVIYVMTCVICIGVIVLFVNYIFVIITACNVPVFRYIFVVFVSKNREKWNKKIWSLCRVHREKHSAKVAIRGIPKKATLPSARSLTLGKV